jgi:hypothetical protein
MQVSSARKSGYGDKARWVKYWARLGCLILPCYGPFPLGGRFETYEPFISLISFFQTAVNRECWISGIWGNDCYVKMQFGVSLRRSISFTHYLFILLRPEGSWTTPTLAYILFPLLHVTDSPHITNLCKFYKTHYLIILWVPTPFLFAGSNPN